MPNAATNWIAAGLMTICLGMPTWAHANDAKALVIEAITELMI